MPRLEQQCRRKERPVHVFYAKDGTSSATFACPACRATHEAEPAVPGTISRVSLFSDSGSPHDGDVRMCPRGHLSFFGTLLDQYARDEDGDPMTQWWCSCAGELPTD